MLSVFPRIRRLRGASSLTGERASPLCLDRTLELGPITRVLCPRKPVFFLSPSEEHTLILLSSPQLDVKETKSKLIPARGGWRLICIKDEWQFTKGLFPMQSLESCAPASTHTHTHTHSHCASTSFRISLYPRTACLSPCFTDRRRKEQNGNIFACLVVFFFSCQTSCLLKLPTFAANLFNEAVVCC